MANFFIFSTSKKVRGPEVKKSANRTGTGLEKCPISGSESPIFFELFSILGHSFVLLIETLGLRNS